jgi:RNA polymerase sigma factor (sigma-70 family)
MAVGQDRRVMRQLGTLFTVGTGGGLTDGQLLERFATHGGDAAERAFTALVERHGPMVLRVCRSVLVDPHDAEDAFQATFLVLVKRARGLWVEDSLGPWLHQVALRTASCARSAAARRARHERVAAMPAAATRPAPDDGLGQVLHEEIDRLPERFRVPVVLCDLEGRTHEQAARHLGWPVGTVKSRLSRARERLRDRLTRRGLSPNAPLIALLRPGGLAELIPVYLVSSTTDAAIRFGASRAILAGAASALAQGVLTTMSMSRWWKVASLLIVAGATVSGAGLLAGRPSSAVEPAAQATNKGGPGTDGDTPVAEVKSGKFMSSVHERGALEASHVEDIFSPVQGPTTLLTLVPEGKKVKKGELVGELDSASLRDQLINQRITVQAAEANYQNAKLARETAEIAVREYVEGIYLSGKATVQGEIKLSESALSRAQGRVERLRKYREELNRLVNTKGMTATSGDILAQVDLDDRLDSAEQDRMREQISLERVQSKLNMLDNYTKPKTIKELKSDVESKLSTELARKAIYQLEREKEARLERQISSCRLVAPCDGRVVYGNNPNRLAGRDDPRIAVTDTVREKQLILRIADMDGPLLVRARVPESQVDRLRPGQKAIVEVDAFLGRTFPGTVAEVLPLPDAPRGPRAASQGSRKFYTTMIKIEKADAGLVPGMTATVAVPIAERDNVVNVPVAAVWRIDEKDLVAVRRPDGAYEWRPVTLGDRDETGTSVEVYQGLWPGDRVALIRKMSEGDRRKFVTGVRPAGTETDPVK